LTIVVLLSIAMVAVGGITRLTRSGLSITEWKPISGALPPLGEEAWGKEFAKYRATPEYLKVNKASGMTVAEFKGIYFWEWFHRLLARLIGVVLAIPFLLLLFARKLEIEHVLKGGLLFLLLAFQAFLGWYMVKSGLVDIPRVSHLRLAAHLGAAIAFISVVWAFALGFRERTASVAVGDRSAGFRRALLLCLALFAVQILYGAFTAGLRAGVVSTTWPLMEGRLIPGDMGWMSPFIRNLFDNPVTVHFVHRSLALGVVFYACLIAVWGLRRGLASRAQKVWLWHLLALAILQLAVGVHVVLLRVPVSLASLHQLLALGLWMSAFTLWLSARRTGSAA
jgi:cytochrome c oxidase assembly protein subunit 15